MVVLYYIVCLHRSLVERLTTPLSPKYGYRTLLSIFFFIFLYYIKCKGSAFLPVPCKSSNSSLEFSILSLVYLILKENNPFHRSSSAHLCLSRQKHVSLIMHTASSKHIWMRMSWNSDRSQRELERFKLVEIWYYHFHSQTSEVCWSRLWAEFLKVATWTASFHSDMSWALKITFIQQVSKVDSIFLSVWQEVRGV